MTSSAMGDILPYRPPREREETTAYLGMVIFLASWAMMFSALFFAYAFVRARATEWPPAGVPLPPLWMPALSTAFIGLSSAAVHGGLVSVKRGGLGGLRWGLSLALLTAAGFLVSQRQLWRQLAASGVLPSTGGSYATALYGLTWLHALHVAVGLLGLGFVTFKAFRGAYSAARHLPVRLWVMYWHFVGIVWALMFVSIFVF
jgi:cytochrome c oxidase subunit 3